MNLLNRLDDKDTLFKQFYDNIDTNIFKEFLQFEEIFKNQINQTYIEDVSNHINDNWDKVIQLTEIYI